MRFYVRQMMKRICQIHSQHVTFFNLDPVGIMDRCYKLVAGFCYFRITKESKHTVSVVDFYS